MVPGGELRAVGALPHPLRAVRPTTEYTQEITKEPHGYAGARNRWRVHRGLLHKRLDALWGEGGGGGRARLMDRGVPALRVEKLKKTYANGLLALDEVSLEIMAGRFFGLLGPNGAGKTTLINSIVSLARPDSGDRKSTRLNSSHANISYAVFCLKKKNYCVLKFFSLSALLVRDTILVTCYDTSLCSRG